MAFSCPECGTVIGNGAAEDGLLHLASCLHFAPTDPDRLLKAFERRATEDVNDGNAQRVYMGLQAYQRDRSSAVGGMTAGRDPSEGQEA